MKIRTIGLSLALFVASSILAGCENFHHGLHSKANEAKDDSKDSNSVIGVEPGSTQPFFKPSRLPGAMSDEGREIEKNLGIH
jgi:hypothetical protein